MKEQIKINMWNLTKSEQEELTYLIKKARVEKKANEKPKKGEWYRFLSSDGRVFHDTWDDNEKDKGRWEIGNVFHTDDAAEFEIKKRKVETILKRYAEEHNDPDKMKWNGDIQYYIQWNYHSRKLEAGRSRFARTNAVHFTSVDVLMAAVEEAGKADVIKYYLGVQSFLNKLQMKTEVIQWK